ncbi:MAG: ribosomal protein S18-alanine N-acetyltransferase [Candidatus Marinimicrobia bacterium]|nr:ribosomal protein S18-alanine N-acetyltransferase [Candidatus Neomarinimicrobiota bacterium]
MIVSASNKHLEQILFIERASFSKPWTEYHFKSDLNNKISMNWVFLKNDQAVGYLFGWHVMDEYHLNNIAVAEPFRGTGIGVHLLNNMELHLKEIEVKSVFLEVSSSNLPARKLYEKMSFLPKGERKDYYTKGDDAVLYTLEF